MPSKDECVEVVVELYDALSPQALNKLLWPGLVSTSPANQVKFCRVLFFGVQDEADLPFRTAAEEWVGDTAAQAAIAALGDLGLTAEQVLELPVPEFRQLLEEHWVADLERVPSP